MARKNDTPQKAAMRELMSGYLKQNNAKIKDGTDVNAIMRDMMSVILAGTLDEEMNEEFGYSKYDYRSKETDNSMEIWELIFHGTEKWNTNPRLSRNTRIPSPRTWKKKYSPCTAKA